MLVSQTERAINPHSLRHPSPLLEDSCDGWLESCCLTPPTHISPQLTKMHPRSQLLIQGTLCHRQTAKASPKHHQSTSTPLQCSKTKLTLTSKLLPSIPRTFCFLFSSDTSNFCMMSRQYSGVTLFICTKTTVVVHLFLMPCHQHVKIYLTWRRQIGVRDSHQLKPMSF